MPIKVDEKKDFYKKINQVYYEENRNINSNKPSSEHLKINYGNRNCKLKIDNIHNDNFLDLVALLVPSLIPMEYFEHYSELKNFHPKKRLGKN